MATPGLTCNSKSRERRHYFASVHLTSFGSLPSRVNATEWSESEMQQQQLQHKDMTIPPNRKLLPVESTYIFSRTRGASRSLSASSSSSTLFLSSVVRLAMAISASPSLAKTTALSVPQHRRTNSNSHYYHLPATVLAVVPAAEVTVLVVVIAVITAAI